MKRINALAYPIIIVSVLLSVISCSKDDVTEPDPTVGLVKLTEGFATGAATKVQVYSNRASVLTGYTRFFLALSDSLSGKRVDKAQIELMPMMDMGTMKHSSPFENPESTTAINHLFPASVVFIMPSTDGNWTVGFKIKNLYTEKEGSLTIPVTVTEGSKPAIKSFIGAGDGNKYFVALVEPSKPKVGINDLEVAIYKKATMMSFPADSSLSVQFTPEMPTMGHGSPNNVNPVHLRKGHFQGKVNFTMTGFWRLNFNFMQGNVVADNTQYIDIEF